MRRAHAPIVFVLVLIWLLGAPPLRAQTQPRPIRGAVTWSQSRAVNDSIVVTRGSTLAVAPGVEVRLGPGVAIYVEEGATFISVGTVEQRARLSNLPNEGRWEGIFGLPGSTIIISATDVVGGGAGGTLLATQSGQKFEMTSARVLDNGGQIRVENTPLVIQHTEISANEMPYGAAVDILFDARTPPISPRSVKLAFNRIAANRLAPGAPTIRIAHSNPVGAVEVDMVGNFLEGFQGPELTLVTDSQINGSVFCNTLTGGTQGIRLVSEFAPPNLRNALQIRLNVIERHQIQFDNIAFVRRSIGLGVSSELSIDLTGNWWGHPNGPFAPKDNPGGQGDAAGVNVQFQPWLSERPTCVP